MKSRKSRSSRLREKAVITLQAWTRGFLTRRALKRRGVDMGGSQKWSNRVCVGHERELSLTLNSACIELYDAFGLESWDTLIRPTQRSSIVVYEEPIEFSSKRPLLLDYEEDDSRHFIYYDDLNRSNSRIRSRLPATATPHRVRRHSPYESSWNRRVLQDFYNVRAPISTMLVKRTQSRLLLDTSSTPLTRLHHRIKRSHSTSTKNNSDEVERRFRRGKPLEAIEGGGQVRGKYQTPKQRGSPMKRKGALNSAG